MFPRGFPTLVTYQHPLFINNLSEHHYFTDYSRHSRSVLSKVYLNIKPYCLINMINNYIWEGDLPKPETAPSKCYRVHKESHR